MSFVSTFSFKAQAARLAESYFKPTGDGWTFTAGLMVLPYWGTSYRVTAAQKDAISALLNRLWRGFLIAQIAAIMGLIVFLGPERIIPFVLAITLIDIGILAVLELYYRSALRVLLASAPQTDERVTYADMTKTQIATMSPGVLKWSIAGGVLLTLGGVIGVLQGYWAKDWTLTVFYVFVVAFFAFCVVRAVNMLRAKQSGA
jgi:hypothetical protein